MTTPPTTEDDPWASGPRGSGSFLEELPFEHRTEDGAVSGELDVTPHLLVPGHDVVHVSALASAADVITGIQVSRETQPLLALTVDLSVRVLAPIGVGPVQMRAEVVKLGRSISATEAWFTRGGRPVAHCWATFMASPRPQDTLPGLLLRKHRHDNELGRPFLEALGVREPRPGVAEVDRRPYTLQPAGTLQGGVVCALAETAARSLTGQPVTEIDLRYLSAIRLGLGRATAEALGPSVTKVIVTDTGRTDHRVATTAFTRH